jgi:DNA replicative helicase MCM subunit Mcm2 (Cdc46/Mcm family)
MGEVLTLAEIYSRFDSEWVLLDEPQTTEDLEVQSGKVLAHSKDRDEVYRKAIELQPKRFAMLFTGSMPEGTAIVL